MHVERRRPDHDPRRLRRRRRLLDGDPRRRAARARRRRRLVSAQPRGGRLRPVDRDRAAARRARHEAADHRRLRDHRRRRGRGGARRGDRRRRHRPPQPARRRRPARRADRAPRGLRLSRASTSAPPASPTSSRPRCCAAAGEDPARADRDLDLVALATIADCVPLRGENRRLVRAGLRALATTKRPGLRALMRVSRADPARIDTTAVGFRLAPRINAAGRLERADAGLELLLTPDEIRAAQIADELDRLNHERRHTETRILFEAEAMVARGEARPARVLRARRRGLAQGRHRDRRLADRRAPPPPDGARRARSARPDGHRLGPLDPRLRPARRPRRGERAPAAPRRPPRRRRLRDRGDRGRRLPRRLRGARRRHADARRPHPGAARRRRRRRRRDRPRPGRGARPPRARSGSATPASRCCCRPRAAATRARWGRATGTCASPSAPGGTRARAVAFGTSTVDCEQPLDATFTLELNEYNGSVEPRLVLRDARPSAPAPITLVGEPADYLAAAFAELRRPLHEVALKPRDLTTAPVRDRRGGGIAGTIAALVASGEPVLVVAADATRAPAPPAADPRRLRAVLARRARARPVAGAAAGRDGRRPTS